MYKFVGSEFKEKIMVAFFFLLHFFFFFKYGHQMSCMKIDNGGRVRTWKIK